jgi:uncharacterized protein YjbJ (UPF0337 family)
LRCQILTLF